MKNQLFTLLFAIAALSCKAQATELNLNLEAGKSYKQVTEYKSTINQTFNGQSMEIIMTMKGAVDYLVTAVNDSIYDLEVRYESLGMSMKMPQAEMEFSSENPAENDVFSLFLSEMINFPFEVKMSKTGKVLEVKRIDALFAKIFDTFPDLPEAQKEQVKSQLMNAYGEAAFKGNIEMVSAIFPDHPVNKGDKWVIETKLESGIAGKLITTYEFLGEKDGYNLIAGNSIFETDDKDAYIESNGMPMKYDLAGTMISQIKIDKNSGWIVDAILNQNIGGDAYIKANPQMPEDMKFTMSMKTEMVFFDK
jgi:hypothetical protein